MTPGLQAAISRLEGQWRNLFRRIQRIRRSAAIDDTAEFDRGWKPLLRGNWCLTPISPTFRGYRGPV